MLTLASDTSSERLEIAILDNEDLIGEIKLNIGYKHSVSYLPAIKSLLKQCFLSFTDIDLFACVTGPGSYTGIRIGLSTVKTFAYALKKPVIGISSLKLLQYAALKIEEKTAVLATIDARNLRVFGALTCEEQTFLAAGNYLATELWDAVAKHQIKRVILIGDGSLTMQRVQAETAAQDCTVLEALNVEHLPLTYYLGKLAFKAHQAGDKGDLAELKANYLAVSQAERLKDQNGTKISK